jgi:hypothetical protein
MYGAVSSERAQRRIMIRKNLEGIRRGLIEASPRNFPGENEERHETSSVKISVSRAKVELSTS